MKSLVSIIITNYNYSNYLSECIGSCLNQKTNISYEVILVDDGSTDNSLEIASLFKDVRLKIIARHNGGIEAASNEGIKKSNGKYVVRVDADDYISPNYLHEIVPRLDDSNYQFAYSDYQVVNEYGHVQYGEKLPIFNPEEIIERGDFLATGTLYLKSAIIDHGLYNEQTPNCGLENYELILKLISSGKVGIHVSKNLFSYRFHKENISTNRRSSIIDYGYKMFKANKLGVYKTNRFHPYKLKV